MQCPNCSSASIEYDQSRGDTLCTECGFILSESGIVSEVNFAESTSGGSSSVVGQFITTNGGAKLSSSAKGSGHLHGAFGRDSREQTLSNGRRLIQLASDSLRLNRGVVDAAAKLYRLAIQHGFIQGRRSKHVAAACCYIICRQQNTPHLLLDFSDIFSTNLYVLGATFLKFVRLLNFKMPIVDPSLYIHRFAAAMEFKTDDDIDKTHLVANTALRLVARMKRDWLTRGRRPTGICGACLLIAARMHGFKRSQREAVEAVRICDATLRRRLNEFISSSGADMTFDEFESLSADQHLQGDQADPPSFIKNRVQEEREQLEIQRKAQLAQKMEETGVNQEPITEKMERELDELLQDPQFQTTSSADLLPIGGTSSFSVKKLIQEHLQTPDGETSAENGNIETPGNPDKLDNITPQGDEVSLSDLDDDELDHFILSDAEVSWKTRVWESINAQYLIEQEKKKALREANPQNKHTYRKKKKKSEPASSAAEATMQVLKEKKVSDKINYSALEGLFSNNINQQNNEQKEQIQPDIHHSNKRRRILDHPQNGNDETAAVDENGEDDQDDYFEDEDDEVSSARAALGLTGMGDEQNLAEDYADEDM